jgi:hypothetical protein
MTGILNGVSLPLHSSHSSSDGPLVEVSLSRPAYRIGGTVVGTVRLVANNADLHPRLCFESAELYVKGSCKIDSRWHNVDEYRMLYGSHPHFDDHEQTEWKLKQENTVCFWATNVISLLDLEERRGGHWKDVKPKPIKISKSVSSKFEAEKTEPFDDAMDLLDQKQLTFTFRADLPADVPHSTSLTCCRYTYSVIVSVKTSSGKSILVNLPFTVLTPMNGYSNMETSTGRVKLGSCLAMAHSAGLPFHITIDEIHQPKGQVTVNRHTSLKAKSRDVQTLRVADLHGTPCCVLTAIGSACMNPGGRVMFHLDFPISSDTWLPCHQVSACLQGQEVAMYEDKTQHRARSYIFDTHIETVEFGYTERLSFTLLLPLDCPCSLQTDLVKIEISCGLDLAVDDPKGGLTNLRLELPIKVVHAPAADEMQRDEDEVPTLRELLHDGNDEPLESDPLKSGSFPTRDIQKDLKVLSLLLVDSCGLKEGN